MSTCQVLLSFKGPELVSVSLFYTSTSVRFAPVCSHLLLYMVVVVAWQSQYGSQWEAWIYSGWFFITVICANNIAKQNIIKLSPTLTKGKVYIKSFHNLNVDNWYTYVFRYNLDEREAMRRSRILFQRGRTFGEKMSIWALWTRTNGVGWGWNTYTAHTTIW